MTLFATQIDSSQIGYFRIFARPLGGTWSEITIFRGAPVVVTSLSSSDPFTDSVGSLSIPQVTPFDAPGQGDLFWLREDTDIDIRWENTAHYDFNYQWEGYIASLSFSFDGSSSELSVDLKGALYALDAYRAKPSYPSRPIPYEILMQRAFSPITYPARLSALIVTFPAGWTKTVPSFLDPAYFSFLKPWGVATGQQWSGLTTRTTGTWDPILTGHVQSMLGVMFDEGSSQWTIRNNGQRRPELFLRRPPSNSDGSILEITLGAPGVGVQFARDFTQMANVIYGHGSDAAGIQYGNMQVAPDGSSTNFLPYAWESRTYPRLANPHLSNKVMAKETQLQFQDGMDEQGAFNVARAQLQRFADPGITGTITLTTDPITADGAPIPRLLLKAGVTFRIKNLMGDPEGILVHATQVTADLANLTTTVQFDSKYRDQLTVEEVQARTRDALDPVRALQVGKYSNLVNDLVLPWSYTEGSGIVPSGGGRSAKDFFLTHLPSSATFPYETYTKQFPPSQYPDYYIKIGPTNLSDSTKNWAVRANDTGAGLPYPFRMAQAGSIKLTQFAAYDKNGNVMPVRFHISIYSNNGAGGSSMPSFPPSPLPPYLNPWGDIASKSVNTSYSTGQTNPFYRNAFEKVQEDGTIPFDTPQAYVPATNSGLIVGWGNYYEPAGYSPGRYSRGATRTGMLVDNTPWTWTFGADKIDLQIPANNALLPDAGMLFINIYCDEQLNQPVYFMGRFFLQEPGQN